MINTIFYFVDDETFDYNTALQQETISPYTIVFNKFDKTIKMGGVSYGQMNRTDVVASLGNISDILPVATNVALGAIKIGYTSNVGAQNRNYGVQLDENNRAFVSVPWTDTITPEYDDSALRGDIATEIQRIDTFIQNLDASIQEKVEDLLEDAQWVEENLTEGQVGGQSTDTTEELLRMYGVWNWVDPNDHSKGKQTYNIAKLQADVLGISGYVGDITNNAVALANLDIKVNGEYTLVVEAAGTDTSGAIEISTISTEIAGLDSVADGDTFRTKSFDTVPASNAIYKKGSTYFHFVKSNNLVDSNTTLTNSISQYGDDFNKLVKMAASVLDLKTSVNGNKISTMADLGSTIAANADQNGNFFTGYSGLSTMVMNDHDTISANSSLLSRITNGVTDPNDPDYGKLDNDIMAGIISEATLGAVSTAKTELVSAINDKTAGITVMVTKDSSTGVVDSGITLKADQVTIDANQTSFKSAVGDFVKTDVLETGVADIKARLTVGGSDPAGLGTPGTITMKNASDGTIGIWDKDKLAVGTTSSPSSSNSAMLVNADGSGSLAKGNISWDTNGSLTVYGNGYFDGVINASSGVFNGVVNATQFKAGSDEGFSITTSPDSLDFNYNGSRLAFFSLRGWDSANNQLADVADNPTGFYLYMTNPLDGHLITIDFANLGFVDLNANTTVRHEATFYRLSNQNGKVVETPVTLYYSLENGSTKWWLHSDSATELTSSEMGTLYKKQLVGQGGRTYQTCVQEVDAGIPYVATIFTLYEQQTLQNNVPTKTGDYAMATNLNNDGSSSTNKWFVVPNSTTYLNSLNTNWSAVFRPSDVSVNETTATTVTQSSNRNTVPTFTSAVSCINRIDENGNVVSVLYPFNVSL